MIRVVIADDNSVLRFGITSHLEAYDDIAVVGEAADGEAALAQVELHRPDVLLLDVQMPRLDGLGVLQQLKVPVAVLMLTNSDDPEVIQQALRLGAVGYLVYPDADAPEIDRAVRRVAQGETVLGSVAAHRLVSLLPDPIGQRVEPEAVREAERDVQASDAARRFRLSAREVEVLELVARGSYNDEIAAELFISEKTVKNHLNRIFAKLNASSRAEAMAIWRGDREVT